MKHLGKIIETEILKKNLAKRDVAIKAGITPQILTRLMKADDFSCGYWEGLCRAVEISPAVGFDYEPEPNYNFKDISVNAVHGDATFMVELERESYKKLLAEKDKLLQEKERMIQILLETMKNGTNSGQ